MKNWRYLAYFVIVASVVAVLLLIFLTKSNDEDAPDWQKQDTRAHVVVIGSGLAGLTTALSLNNDFKVIVLEKSDTLGGNSSRASSGINALLEHNDEVDFMQDTFNSRGSSECKDLMLPSTLVAKSRDAKSFLESQGVVLDQVVKLGGHTRPRTHRNSQDVGIGHAIMSKLMMNAIQRDNLEIRTGTAVTNIKVLNENKFSVETNKDTIEADIVVVATGGFSASKTLLAKYKREISNLPTTNGIGATGDAFEFLRDFDVELVDMSKIQTHPTAFVDKTTGKCVLAAEILRSAGGVLLNSNGERFCDELDTRANIVNAMNEQKQSDGFMLQIPKGTADDMCKHHIDMYMQMGFLRDDGDNYVGQVQPAVHYTMGGLNIDEHGRVLKKDGGAVDGLFAAGEVTGGVHGENRLGGNSLLECAVFGLQVAKEINGGKKMKQANKNVKEEVVNFIVLDVKYAVPRSVALTHAGGDLYKYEGKDITDLFMENHSPQLIERFRAV